MVDSTKKWIDIASDPEFQAQPEETRAKVRDDYYWQVVGPNFDTAERQARYAEWVERTKHDVSPPPPVAKSTGQYVGNEAKSGVADVLSLGPMAVDLATKVAAPVAAPMLEGIKGVEKPTPTHLAKDLREGYNELAGVKKLRAPSEGAEYAGTLARYGVGGLPFSGIPVAQAGRAGLKAAALIEGMSTLGGGTGAYVGRKAGEPFGEKGAAIGEAVGALGMGGGTAMLAPKLLTKAASIPKAAVDRARGEDWDKVLAQFKGATTEAERTVAGNKLAELFHASPDARERLLRAIEIQHAINPELVAAAKAAGIAESDIPQFAVDLSMSKAPGIEKLKDIVDRQNIENLQRARTAQKRNLEAVARYRQGAFKSDETMDRLLSAEAEERISQYEAALADIENRKRAVLALNTEGRASRNEEVGKELRDLMDKELKIRKEQASAAYSSVIRMADDLGVRVSEDEVMRFIEGKMNNPAMLAQQKPPAFSSILSAVRNRKTIFDAYGAEPEQMPLSLSQWVTQKGGVNRKELGGDIDADITTLPVGLSTGRKGLGIKRVINNGPNSQTPDALTELAIEAGYLPEGSDMNDFLRMMNDELRAGRPMFFSTEDVGKAQALIAERKMLSTPPWERAETPLSFGESLSIIQRARRDARVTSDPVQKKMLGDLEQYMLQKIEGAPNGKVVREALKNADEWYRDRVIRSFYEGAAQQIGSRTKLLGQRTPDSEVAAVFYAKGGVGANEWKSIFGQDERANQLLQQSVFDDFASKVLFKKKLDAQSIAQYIEKHDDFLIHFPQIRERLVNGHSLVEGLVERGAQLEGELKEFQKNLLTKLVLSKDTEGVIAGALNDKRVFTDLLERAKAVPGATDAVRRAVADYVAGQADPVAYLASHREAIGALVGPEHMKKLDVLAGAQALAKGTRVPEAVTTAPFTGDPLKEATGIGIPSLFARMRQVVLRRTGSDYMMVDIGSNVVLNMRKQDMMRMMSDAIYDPVFAEKLMALDKAVWRSRAAELGKGGMRKAMEGLKNALEELKPHWIAHGMRVTVDQVGGLTGRFDEGEDLREGDARRRELARRRTQQRLLNHGVGLPR